MRHRVLCATGRALARTSIAAIVLIALVVMACVTILYVRHHQQQRDTGAVAAPRVAQAAELPREGSFLQTVRLTDLQAPGTGEFGVTIPWDDAWFFSDPTRYNPDLAYASSVLASLAYAESGYYQQGSDQPAYMELALASLGFEDVSTESYRYRSEVVDEVLSLVTQTADSAAYAIASKSIASADGAYDAELILVSVRGSYGSEWLSNLQILFEQDERAQEADRAIADAVVRSSGADRAAGAEEDNPGYTEAAREICDELSSRIRRAHGRGRSVKLLVVGHSRGGAIANLVGACACDSLSTTVVDNTTVPLHAGDEVFTYTFATPGTTTDAGARGGRYASIFNVLNPADIMTYLPLQAWGYERYGVDASLPSSEDESFAERYEQMASSFADIVGSSCPVDADADRKARALIDDLSERIASIEELKTPAGVAHAFAILAERVDPTTMLNGHYPSVYIAWLAQERQGAAFDQAS